MRAKNYLFCCITITFLSLFSIVNTYGQSDDCANAVSITPTTTCGTGFSYDIPNSFTTDNTVSNTSCIPDPADIREDGWFSFVANSTLTTISAVTDRTDRDVALAVYEGGCGGTQITGACADAGGDGDAETLSFTTVVGVTYLIRVMQYNDGSGGRMRGNMCVFGTPPPANDECTGAFDLPVGQFECAFGGITNEGATFSNTFGGNPTCANGTSAEDVWYKFVAPAGGQAVIDTQAGTITNSGMELYRSTDGTCNTLTSVACDNNSGTGNMSRILDYNLVGGATYYLRVWRNGGGEGTMDICIQNQYSDCDVSFPICSSTSFNTNSFGVGDEVTNIAGCFGNSDELETVWMTFTTQSTGTIGFTIDPQSATDDDYDFVLYRAASTNFCDDITTNGSIVSCNASSSTGTSGTTGIDSGIAAGFTDNDPSPDSENPGNGNPYNDFVNTTAGDRYFLVIDNFNTSNIGFDISFSGTASLDCSILPLEFTEFGGEKVKDQNLLHWATAREYNTSHFEIERSSDAMDFVKIGELKSGSKKLENQIYQYWDSEPQNGINYYRLKQVDVDGTFTYTKTIAIDNQGSITTFELQKMYPNPAQNTINFVFAVPSSNSEIQIEIFDSNGKSVAKTINSYQKGVQHFNQNVASFSKGLYILRLSNLKTGEILTEKFIKK